LIQKSQQISDLLGYVEDLQNSKTREGVFEILQKFTRLFGFQSLTLGMIANLDINTPTNENFIKSDLLKEILTLWFEKNMILHDPIVKYAMQYDGSFFWSDALKHASTYSQEISEMHVQYAMKEGLAVSSKAGGLQKTLFSMAHPNPQSLGVDTIALIELACIYSHNCILRLSGTDKENDCVRLTKREVEVLTLVAAGKTNWEIAQIYKISEGAIKKHMQNIQNKLQASNRVHASVLAIKSGQILP